MNNEVKVVGKIKNIKCGTDKSGGNFVTGWFDQREISSFSDGNHDRQVYIFGINIVSFDKETVETLAVLDQMRAGEPATQLVSLTGRLQTRFDRRTGIPESQRRQPMLQLVVDEMTLV